MNTRTGLAPRTLPVHLMQNTFKKAFDEKQCILGNSLGRGNQIFLFNKN